MHTRSPIAFMAAVVAIAIPALVGSPPTAAQGRRESFVTPAAREGKRIEARHGVVTSASAAASDAGVEMLRAGGNAVDAAVATAFALGVVEPQMSGLGGGGAAMIWIQRDRTSRYLDFYAAQPADSWRAQIAASVSGASEPDTGQPLESSAVAPGAAPQAPRPPGPGDLRVVGIPGAVAGLLALHEQFGGLARADVLAPAIRLAADGFAVGHVLSTFIASGAARMKPFPEALALYLPDGKALAPGVVLRNPALAESLTRIAREGRSGFYEGETARQLVTTLNAGGHPATLADLDAYQPQWKRPLCTDYRGLTVLSAPPPQTGFQVLHTLELLEPFGLRRLGLPTRSAAAFDVLASALRVGQAAARHNGDPNWVAVPASGLSSAEFAATRRSLIGTRAAPASVEAADASAFDHVPAGRACGRLDIYGSAPPVPGPAPTQSHASPAGDETEAVSGGETTHLSVVDRHGNAVALTITNSDAWGSGGFTGGFFLNNSGFRFSRESVNAGSRSRWRIRTTTIAPTVVLDGEKVQMVIGAPGAGRIPTEIVQVMVYTLDYGLDPLEAVDLPRIYPSPRSRVVQIEHGFAPRLLREVREMGYDPVAESGGYARLYLVVRRGNRWVGVADPRHDGEARGY
jgi:gamma-glutamyltranspeptidase/glutathione hydrolase